MNVIVTGGTRVNPYSAGIDFNRQNLTSVDESDVCRRQILTTKVYPRAVRVNP